jgi:hypothetical protein
MLHVMDQRLDDLMKHWGPAEGALQQHLVPEEAALWFSPEPLVHFGSPAESMLQIATEHRSDLIVLGVRPEAGHLGAAIHLPWTTAHQVLARCMPSAHRARVSVICSNAPRSAGSRSSGASYCGQTNG